jgi:CheY-like chemotaxis protein
MGPRILLVESEIISRRKISQFLASGGYAVHEAESGRTALNLLQSSRFDLIVVDLRLIDGINGIEVVACAASLQPGVISVVLGRPKDLGDCNAIDAVFVSKPVRLEELRLKIALLLIHQTQIVGITTSTRAMIANIRSQRAASIIQGQRCEELCARLRKSFSRNLQLRERARDLKDQLSVTLSSCAGLLSRVASLHSINPRMD